MVHLATGEIIKVRSRQYLIEDIQQLQETEDSLLQLACLEDDALGEPLEIFWGKEVDAQIVGKNPWNTILQRGFDDPKQFSAYLHTLRWNCVTSTNPKLFQAPYRAGIQVKAYQLEPLRKALLMPRVNLFIADDVGLGKTIEAGLILTEMLMRQKVRRVVISCPPSVVRQWKEEMESRFGLIFQIFDRDFVARMRQERGYTVNPWITYHRFIISHALLRNEAYSAPLRDWLGDFNSGSMLILDEAHNAAPASGAKYAVDSHLTRTLRDVAPRFEHKLFLSATPHNGHSNSFTALLEMLDPQRFCRGVPVQNRELLNTVMVRRLKQDLRAIGEEFPIRQVIPIMIDNLPQQAPELQLSHLLQEYRQVREEKLKLAPKSIQTTASLVITSLQKRLLSSIEAFARTLKVHQTALHKQQLKFSHQKYNLLQEAPDQDDDRAELPEAEIQQEEDSQLTQATQQTQIQALTPAEIKLLSNMTDIANQARYLPDPRVIKLIEWIKQNLCPQLGEADAPWLNRRVIIFTEYTDTKSYLQHQLQEAIMGSNQYQHRLDVFHGGMGEQRREAIKQAFNTDPSLHPLRILIATDAAREGVNLQNHCADLFHFDIPWNPSRMEQRNGRIDRKLQKAPQVNCYYFIFTQRPEDKVLKVLVKKTETIQKELGTLSPVLQKNLSRLLDNGITHRQINQITQSITELQDPRQQTIQQELEDPEHQERQKQLINQLSQLQRMLETSQQWLNLNDQHFQNTISAALELLGAPPLTPVDGQNSTVLQFPALDKNQDATWSNTLDSLRTPKPPEQNQWEWRKQSSIRPVVFRDPGNLDGDVVHLHLEHRVVQRLFRRFLSQGFIHQELNRACVCFTNDPIPQVIALGRLCIYGPGASRLHDEIITIAAHWSDPSERGKKKLQPLKELKKQQTIALLESSLADPNLQNVPPNRVQRLQQQADADIEQLIPHLESTGQILAAKAEKQLTARGEKEAGEMKKILEQQQQRIRQQQEITEEKSVQLSIPNLAVEEERQIEADRRHWEKRLEELAEEIKTEPERIQATYSVKAKRLEPVGLVYLWPVSG